MKAKHAFAQTATQRHEAGDLDIARGSTEVDGVAVWRPEWSQRGGSERTLRLPLSPTRLRVICRLTPRSSAPPHTARD